jgi:nickel transport system substrate-binding protein
MRDLIKRAGWISLVLVFLMFTLIGCGQNEATAPDGEGAGLTLTVSATQDIGPLDPHRYSPNYMFAQNLVYESLVRYGPGGQIKPWLAESWEISPDGKTYTFHLRKGVVFSDGTPFEAAVVKQNFDKILTERQEEEKHTWLELVNQINRVEVVDRHTVQLILHEPYYPTLIELTLTRPVRFLGPVGFDQEGQFERPIGTGPWVLEEHHPDAEARFVRNEQYWGIKPAFDTLVLKVIPDGESRVLALEAGEIDLIFGVGQIGYDVLPVLADKGFTVDVSDPLKTHALALNSARGATQEEAVRLAIQHAVDREALAQMLTAGYEQPADALFAPNVPYADLGLTPFAYDPQQAATILDEAGWHLPAGQEIREKEGRPLRLELFARSDLAHEKPVAEAVQGFLRAVGIELAVQIEEKASVFRRQKEGEFDLIFAHTWGPPYDPHSLVSSMRVPSHADFQAQKGLPDKAELDAKIGQVLVTTSETERQELYAAILGSLHDQGVYLPLTHPGMLAVYGPQVAEFAFCGTQYELDWAQVRPALP